MSDTTDVLGQQNDLLQLLQKNLVPPPSDIAAASKSLKIHFGAFSVLKTRLTELESENSECKLLLSHLQASSSKILDLFEEHDSLDNCFVKAKLLKQQLQENQLNKDQFQQQLDSGLQSKSQVQVLQNELQVLKQEYAQLQKDLFAQQENNASLQARNSDLDAQGKRAIERFTALQLTFDKTKTSNDRLVSDNQDLQRKLSEAQSELQALKRDFKQLEEQHARNATLATSNNQLLDSKMQESSVFQTQKAQFCANLTDILHSAVSDQQDFDAIFSAIKREVEAARTHAQQYKQELHQATEQLKQLEQDRENQAQELQLLAQLKSAVNQHYGAQDDQFIAIARRMCLNAEEIAQVSLENKQLVARNNACERQCQEVQFKFAQADELSKAQAVQLRDMQRQLLEMQSQQQSLESTTNAQEIALQRMAEDNMAKSQELEQKTGNLQENKASLLQLKQEHDDLVREHKITQMQLDNINQQYDQQQEFSKQLSIQLEQVKTQFQQISDDKAKFITLINKIGDKVFGMADQLQDIGKFCIQRIYKPEEYVQLASENQNNVRELDALRKQNADYESCISAFNKLEQELAHTLRCNVDSKEIVKAARDLSNEADNLEQLRVGLEERVATLTKQLDQCAGNYEDLLQNTNALKNEHFTLQSELQSVQRQFVQTDESLQEAQRLLMAKQELISKLEELQNKQDLDMSQTTQAAANSTQQVELLTIKNQQYAQQAEETSAQLTKLRQQNQTLTATLQQTKLELNNLQTDKADFIIAANSFFCLPAAYNADAKCIDMVEDIRQTLNRRAAEIPQLQQKISVLKAQLAEANQQVIALQPQVDVLQDLRIKLLTTLQLDQNTPNSTVLQAVESKLAQNQTLFQSNSGIQEQCSRQELNLKQLWQELDRKQVENTQMLDEVSKMRISYADTEKRNRQLQVQLEETQIFLQTKEEEVQLFKEQFQKTQMDSADSTQQAAQTRFLNSQLSHENAELSAKVATLTEENDVLAQQQREKDVLLLQQKQQLNQMFSDKIVFVTMANSEFQLENVFQTDAKLEDIGKLISTELQRRPSQFNELQCKLFAAQKQIDRFEQDNAALELEIGKLREFDYAITQKCMLAGLSFGDKQDALERLYIHDNEVTKKNTGLMEAFKQSESEVQRLQELLHIQEQKAQDLTDQYQKLQAQHANVTASMYALQQQLDEACLVLQQREEQLTTMQANLSASDIKNKAVNDRIAESDFAIKQVTREVETLRAENAQLLKQNQDLQQQLEQSSGLLQIEREGRIDLSKEKQDFLYSVNANFGLVQQFDQQSSLSDVAAVVARVLAERPGMLLTLQSSNQQAAQRIAQLEKQQLESTEQLNNLQYFKAKVAQLLGKADGQSDDVIAEFVAQMCAEHSDYSQRAKKLDEVARGQHLEIEQLTDQLKLTNQRLCALQDEYSQMKSEHGDSLARIRLMQDELDAAHGLLAQKQEQLELQSNVLQSSRAEHAALNRTSAEHEFKYQQQVRTANELEIKLAGIQAENDKLHIELDALRQTEQRYRDEADELRQERTNFVIQVNQTCSLSKAYSTDDPLEQIARELGTKISMLPALLPSLQSQVLQLQAQAQSDAKTIAANNELISGLKQLKFEVCRIIKLDQDSLAQNITEILARVFAEHALLSQQVVGLTEQSQQQHTQLGQLGARLDAARLELNAQNQEMLKVKQEFAETTRQLQATQQNLDQSHALLQQKTEELEHQRDEFANARAESAQSLKEAADITAKQHHLEREYREQTIQLEETQQRSAHLAKQNEELQMQQNVMREQLRALRDEKLEFIITANKRFGLPQTFAAEDSLQTVAEQIAEEFRINRLGVPELQRQIAVCTQDIEQRSIELDQSRRVLSELDSFKRQVCRIFRLPVGVQLIEQLTEIFACSERNRLENTALTEKNAKQSVTIAQLQQQLDQAKQLNSQLSNDLSLAKEQFTKSAKELEQCQDQLTAAASSLQKKEEELAEIRVQTRQSMLNAADMQQKLASTEITLHQTEKQIQYSASDIQQLQTQNQLLEDQLEQFQSQLNEARTLLSQAVLEKTNFIVQINGQLKLAKVFQSGQSLEEVATALVEEVRKYPDMIPKLQQQIDELLKQVAACTEKNAAQAKMTEKLHNFKALAYQIMQTAASADSEVVLELMKKCYDTRNVLELQVQQVLAENKKFKLLNEEQLAIQQKSSAQLQLLQQERNKLVVQLQQNQADMQNVQAKLDQAYITLQQQEETIQMSALNTTQQESRIQQNTNELSHYQTTARQLQQELDAKTEALLQLEEQFQQLKFVKEQLTENMNKTKQQLKVLSVQKMHFIVSINELQLAQTFEIEDSLEDIAEVLRSELKKNENQLPKLQGSMKALSAENALLQQTNQRILSDNKAFQAIIQQLKQQLQVSSHERLIETVAQIVRENGELKARDEENQTAYRNVVARLEQLQNKFSKQADELSILREAEPILKAEIVDLRDKLGNAQQVIQESAKQLQQVQEEYAKLSEQNKMFEQRATLAEGHAGELEQLISQQQFQLDEQQRESTENAASIAEIRRAAATADSQLIALRKEYAQLVHDKELSVDCVNNKLRNVKVYSYTTPVIEIVEDLVEQLTNSKNAGPELLSRVRLSESAAEKLVQQNQSLNAEAIELRQFKQQVQEVLELGDIPSRNIVQSLEQLKNQVEHATTQCQQIEDKNLRLEEQIHALRVKLAQTEDQLREQAQTTMQLKAELMQTNEAAIDTQRKLDGSQRILLQQQEFIETQKHSAAAPGAGGVEANEQQLLIQNQQLQQQNSALEQIIADQKAQLAENALHQNCDTIPFEKVQLQRQVNQLNQENVKLVQQIDELKTQQFVNKTEQMQLSTVQTPDILLNKLLELQQENLLLKQAAQSNAANAQLGNGEETTRLNSQIACLTQRLLDQQEELLSVKMQAANAQQQAAGKMQAVTDQLISKTNEMQQIRSKQSSLEILATPCQECETLRAQIARLAEENAKLKQTQEALQNALRTAQTAVLERTNTQEDDSRIAALESQLENCAATIGDQKRQIQEQQRRLQLSERSQQFFPQGLDSIQQQVELITQQNQTLLSNMKRLADAISDPESFKAECFRQFGCYPDISGACRRCLRMRAMLRDNETRDQLVLKGRKCICIIGSSMYSFDLRVRKMREFVDVLADVLM